MTARVLCCLGLWLFGSACAAAAPSCEFEALGDPVSFRDLPISAVTQDPDRHWIAWGGYVEPGLGRAALIGIRTDTGESVCHDLSKYGSGKIALIQGPDGNVYLYVGSPAHFLRYDAARRELQNLGVPIKSASYFGSGAIGPDGRFYIGSYPTASLVCCDTRSGKIQNLGRLPTDPKQRYIFPNVCVSDEGVVYAPVGLHHMELWAFDPTTSSKQQILPAPCTERQGSPQVWKAADGKVYTRCGAQLFLCRPDGVQPIKTAPAAVRVPLLAGDTIVGNLNEEGQLRLTDTKNLSENRSSQVGRPSRDELPTASGAGSKAKNLSENRPSQAGRPSRGELPTASGVGSKKVRWLPTDYRGRQAAIFSVACQRDGKIYGSSLLPGHTFSCDTATGRLADLGILDSGKCQVYDIISLSQGLFFASYFGAYVDLFDPAAPIVKGQNPRPLGHAAGQERPVQWCLGPDNMLYTGTMPSKGRLGGAILRVDPADLALKTWPSPIPNQSVMYVAAVPEANQLFCTTSIQGGSSAIATEKEACVFLWDLNKEALVLQTQPLPGAKSYGRAVRARNGLIYGLGNGQYYVFDPRTRSVVHAAPLPVKAVHFPELHDQPVGPRGLLVGLGDDGVFTIDPADNRASVLARHESIRRAHGFCVTDDGMLYYGSGATLMRCKLGL